jgi:hypothetical protein
MVEQAVIFMEQYRISPPMITDHLTSLYFSADKSQPLAEIPSSVKAKLTRLFNKRHEEARLVKQSGKNKGKV